MHSEFNAFYMEKDQNVPMRKNDIIFNKKRAYITSNANFCTA